MKLATEACEVTQYKQAHILSTLGAAHAELGDFKEAMTWVNKGIEIGNEEEQEALRKELQSYEAEKPWRELLRDGESVPVDN